MKKNIDNQLFFDFDAAENTAPAVNAEVSAAVSVPAGPEVGETVVDKAFDRQMLQQAVLAHLVKCGAAGAALHVPCRLKKFQADAAAYFSEYNNRLNSVTHCTLVNVYCDRISCIPQCGGEAVVRQLAELRSERSQLEQQIRIAEPQLQSDDELFDEFRSFDYSRSGNRAYHRLCRKIQSMQQSLYKGTPLELLARAQVADYLIVAVPENLISVEEIPDGWGLWYVCSDKSVVEIKTPMKQDCSPEARLHLVQNIGHAALNSVLFANGIRFNGDMEVKFTRLPRARRK